MKIKSILGPALLILLIVLTVGYLWYEATTGWDKFSALREEVRTAEKANTVMEQKIKELLGVDEAWLTNASNSLNVAIPITTRPDVIIGQLKLISATPGIVLTKYSGMGGINVPASSTESAVESSPNIPKIGLSAIYTVPDFMYVSRIVDQLEFMLPLLTINKIVYTPSGLDISVSSVEMTDEKLGDKATAPLPANWKQLIDSGVEKISGYPVFTQPIMENEGGSPINTGTGRNNLF